MLSSVTSDRSCPRIYSERARKDTGCQGNGARTLGKTPVARVTAHVH